MTAAIVFQSSTGQTVALPSPDLVRAAPPRHYQDHFNRNASYFAGPGQIVSGWFGWLSEPVRSRPSLLPAANPALFSQINYVQYSFSLQELLDKGAFSLSNLVPKNLAKVSISEIPIRTTARVGIKEIRFPPF